ncbi:MAG: hypothetical protein M3077_13190 [Candidatus Dormibacteraeota bacterium]|nr:hypothetical protein [Candidatus Dormibacteraeota bacterium]
MAGSSSWVGQVIGLQGKLSDAAPGTVLFVVGLLVVWVTRFDIRVRRGQPRFDIRVGGGDPFNDGLPEHRRKAG